MQLCTENGPKSCAKLFLAVFWRRTYIHPAVLYHFPNVKTVTAHFIAQNKLRAIHVTLNLSCIYLSIHLQFGLIAYKRIIHSFYQAFIGRRLYQKINVFLLNKVAIVYPIRFTLIL